MKYGKKYADSIKAYDRNKQYEAGEAVGIVLDNAKAKFDETVELHVRLGSFPVSGSQVRRLAPFFHGTGKVNRVTLVIAKGARANAAKERAADYVGARGK